MMKFKFFFKFFEGCVKEIFGIVFSVGCQVDGKSFKVISDVIVNGEIDSMCGYLFYDIWGEIWMVDYGQREGIIVNSWFFFLVFEE